MPRKPKRKIKNSKFKSGIYKFKVRRSATGLGLFAADFIPKGKCIIEYKGHKLSRSEQYTSKSKYLFEINSQKTIDGASRRYLARYINHSCLPNAEIQIWRQRGWIVARKNIKSGEEINYDYGKEYWNEHIKPKGCRCVKCKINN